MECRGKRVHRDEIATTDLKRHDLSYLGIGSPKPDDARSITRNLRNLPLAAPIRTKYMYCNMMYTVATHLVEVKAEQSFADFLQARFFDPLGMDSTCLQPAAARARGLGDRIATGHHWVKKKGYSRFQTPDCPEAQGAGSIMTSANDFIKYVKALMNQEGPITERLYRDLIRMRTIANPNTKWLRPHTSAVIYTVGLEIYWYRGHMIVGHDGSIAGFGSRFFFLPDLKFGACIFGNSSDAATITGILSRELIDIVLEVPESERCQSSKHGIPTRFIEPSNAPPKATKSEPKQLYAEKQKPVKRNAQIQESNSEAEAQVLDLDAYTGRYWNAGYHTMIVEIKNDKLFIDATDRSFPLTLTFEHVSGQTKYIARETYVLEGGNNPLDTEFELHDNKAVRMGLNLEDEEGRMIWFDKVT